MSIINKTLALLAIFLVTPIAMIAINWQWSPEALNETSEYFFWMTESAGSPWAMLTSFVLLVIFIFCLKIQTKAQFVKLFLVVFCAVVVGQCIKSTIKTYTGESRPFVIWIEEEYQVDNDYFYSLPRSERKAIIEQYVKKSPTIPHWLYQHWRNETGYSFPSGHTLFATTWAFLALLLLGLKRHQTIVVLIVIWAVLIEISRLSLGMHHSVDIIWGSFLAWLIALFCYAVVRKWRLVDLID